MSADVLMKTQAGPLRKARTVNQTSNGYVSKVPTATEPTGDAGTATGAAVIELTDAAGGGPAANGIKVIPYAVGANNATFSVRVIGWARTLGGGATAGAVEWTPAALVELGCTVSSSCPGAGAALLATELLADTLTITGTTANAGVGVDVVSPANDTPAHAFVDLRGCQKVELSFTTGGSATSCNALYQLL